MVVGHTSRPWSLEEVEVVVVERPGAVGAGPQVEEAPWTEYPWVVGAGLQRLQAVGAVAMEAGCRWRG